VHSCESFGELCTCLDLDIGTKTAQNIVKKCDLLMRIVAGSGREKVGDAIDYSQPVPGAGVASGLTSSSSTDWLSARAMAVSEFVLTGMESLANGAMKST
jgi:hypothetical protein